MYNLLFFSLIGLYKILLIQGNMLKFDFNNTSVIEIGLSSNGRMNWPLRRRSYLVNWWTTETWPLPTPLWDYGREDIYIQVMDGPGIWSLISLGKCDNDEDLEEIRVELEAEKHKINRTHDGINAKVKLTHEINDDYAVLIEICKHVDGGCKEYTVLSDNSVPNFGRKYAKENMNVAFTLANIDPPDFPVDSGEYEVEDFVMNFCELPRNCPYGKYEALSYMLFEKKKVGCVKSVLECNEFEDGNFCDE